jgi:tungstate transport system substrate-binding protein
MGRTLSKSKETQPLPTKTHLILTVLVSLFLILAACASPPNRLRLATTTSTDNSGLLDAILDGFEQEYSAKVEVIAVGTGQAIALGERGDADVLLVHAREKEDAFVASGHGINRQDVMYNDFIVIGPEADPAGISGLTDATDAFKRIAESKSTFISRGDDSGTNTKELALWKKAGISPTPDDEWYLASGQGMGATLSLAQEKQAYTLSDRATYLAWGGKMDLVILTEEDEFLRNPYGVIAVNPEKHPSVNNDLAQKFIDWITSVDTQKTISEFGTKEYGQPLFFPDSDQWRAANQSAINGG